jgi:diacylglycerol kinase (ATP)
MALIEPKGKTGIPRLAAALACSMKGMRAAIRHEDAFRMELLMAVVLVPLALWLPLRGPEKALMIACVMLVLVVELINTAIEATVDRISLEQHPLSARAKDIGSAAVGLSLVNLASVWLLILLG